MDSVDSAAHAILLCSRFRSAAAISKTSVGAPTTDRRPYILVKCEMQVRCEMQVKCKGFIGEISIGRGLVNVASLLRQEPKLTQ